MDTGTRVTEVSDSDVGLKVRNLDRQCRTSTSADSGRHSVCYPNMDEFKTSWGQFWYISLNFAMAIVFLLLTAMRNWISWISAFWVNHFNLFLLIIMPKSFPLSPEYCGQIYMMHSASPGIPPQYEISSAELSALNHNNRHTIKSILEEWNTEWKCWGNYIL